MAYFQSTYRGFWGLFWMCDVREWANVIKLSGCCWIKRNDPWHLFQEEHGAHLDPAAGVEDERLNGVSGSSAALHHAAGPKKKRHRIPRQEKEKEQQVGGRFTVQRQKAFRHLIVKNKWFSVILIFSSSQIEPDMSVLTETQFGEMPSPTSLSHWSVP